MKKILLLSATSILMFGCSERHVEAPKQDTPQQVVKVEVEKPVVAPAPKYTREEVLDARKKYQVEVLRFNKELTGSYDLRTNMIRLKITNNSDIALPFLTVKTSRFGTDKEVIWARFPSIPVSNLKPGESFEFDYYARGAIEGKDIEKITVEVEQILDQQDEQFIKELPKQ